MRRIAADRRGPVRTWTRQGWTIPRLRFPSEISDRNMFTFGSKAGENFRWRTPLLSRGGVAATSRKHREATLLERTGGAGHENRILMPNTTPSARAIVASHFSQ